MRIKNRVFWAISALMALNVGTAAAQDFVQPLTCGDFLVSRLGDGSTAFVLPGEPNRLRAEPSVDGQIVGEIPGDSVVDVSGDPQCVDGILWVQTTFAGVTGWTAEGQDETYFLEPLFERTFFGYYPFDDHIQFRYDPLTGDDAQSQTFPTVLDDGSEIETVSISFTRYNELDQTYGATGGVLSVYPLPEGTETDAIAALESANETGIAPSALFATPEIGFASRVQAINGDGTRGIRFITYYAIPDTVLLNTSFFYVYQGVSKDGTYLVSLTIPVSVAALPTEIPADLDRAAFTANYEAYLTETQAQIDAAAPSTIVPLLERLDRVAESIRIDPPDAQVMIMDAPQTVNIDTATITVPPEFAARVEVDTIAATTEANSMFGMEPGYTRAQFIGYPVIGAYQGAAIYVYDMATFAPESIYETGRAEVDSLIGSEIDISTIAGSNLESNLVPFLPVYNAAQVFVVQPETVEWAGGRGLRFLTRYAQDASPTTNEGLFYAFIGQTDAGQIVSATFPVRTDSLPDSIDYATFDYEAYGRDYEANLAEELVLLDGLTADDFTPSLDALDAMVETLVTE